jgi:hypothetical protein
VNGNLTKQRSLRLMLTGGLVGAMIAACTLLVPVVAQATETNFCVGTYAGNEYCNQDHSHNINWISAQAEADAFCVMRATEGWAGAPSASGKEYCSSAESGGYVYQAFYGLTGYAQTHNRHSYDVAASPTFEYS